MRLALLAVCALLAFAVARPAAAEGTKVTVGHNRIEPAEIRVKAGDRVTFHNVDAMPGGHTVAAQDGSFSSPPLDEGEEWTHTFDEPGTYQISIEQHPKATGTIVVE